ncbi:MAG TPA: 3-keto-5-aminohexanoate cleavage protein [Planctomycetota bacterium]|nr:3-keto-5-aminohexanoate cleavage protein [Planctomycetota bacterium]
MARDAAKGAGDKKTESKAGHKVIITCAVTGAIHTPSMSPHLPVTAAQIAKEAVAAAEAGAAILHLHARKEEDGRPSPDPDDFQRFLPQIRSQTDAVINITTGGGQNMTVEERMQAALRFKPEMCSLNMGSMNFGLYMALDKIKQWKYAWEPEYLANSKRFIFRNTFEDIETILEKVGKGGGAKFEFECYDVGHLYTLAHMLERKKVEPPLFVQFIFGILGGIGPETENLLFMLKTAERLFGKGFEWSVLGVGRHQLKLGVIAATLGGNVRVGLEDSLYIGKGQLAVSNAEQVRKLRGMLSELSIEIATPAEVRERLKLKGL